jgi:predicted PurR-regulated permease PerM
MAVEIYQPPKQSVVGQWIDVIVLLVLIFLALFVPVWLKIAVPSRVEKLPEGVSYAVNADGAKTWTGLSWEALGQNPTMQQQWEKLGYTVETAADIITQPFDYTFEWGGVIGMIVLIGGYFAFLLIYSKKEYRQVIAERFDARPTGAPRTGAR